VPDAKIKAKESDMNSKNIITEKLSTNNLNQEGNFFFYLQAKLLKIKITHNFMNFLRF